MRNSFRPAITGVIVGLLAFGGTRTLEGQQETAAVPSDTGVVANPADTAATRSDSTQAGQMNDSAGVWRDRGTYVPPSPDPSSMYAPPRSDSGTYAPPDSATYAPPRSDSGTYARPDSATYAPPR
jgi:hypothetical protein